MHRWGPVRGGQWSSVCVGGRGGGGVVCACVISMPLVHAVVLCVTYNVTLTPYSKKLLREKIFTNW